MQELKRKTVEQFRQAEKNKIIVVLDNIRSAYNVGSIFRTGDAFLIEAVYICGYTPSPTHRSVHKTALGSAETVAWKHFINVEIAIDELKNSGYKVYAIEQAEESISLEDFAMQPNDKIAVIFGNEVTGVQEKAMMITDGCIEIPQQGMKHSLNVSVAAGVILWKMNELILQTTVN